MAYALGFAALVGAGVYFCYKRGYAHFIPALLFVAALILWLIGLSFGHASFDGLAVMIAVVLATGVAFSSEFKSNREFEALNKPGQSVSCNGSPGGADSGRSAKRHRGWRHGRARDGGRDPCRRPRRCRE